MIGTPSVLIVTPNRSAGAQTRIWAKDLRSELADVRLVDIIAVDVPFFITEEETVEKARKIIAKKYWPDAWVITKGELKDQLNLPEHSSQVFVYVLDSDANIINRFGGSVSENKISQIKNNLNSSTIQIPN